MASETSSRLRRIWGGCALMFVLALILMVIGEARGLPHGMIRAALILLACGLSAIVGVVSSTSELSGFQVAGRRVPSVYAGMAGSAAWAAAALVLGAPTSLFLAGYDGRPILLGLTGGHVLLAVLIGPFLRSAGARTVPDFLAARYGGAARLLAVCVVVVCSLIFAAALIVAGVSIIGRVFGIHAGMATGMLAAVLLLCMVAGGTRGAVSTQVAQHAVLLIGSLGVFFLFAARPYDAAAGIPYDALARAIDAAAQGLGLAPARSPRSIPFHLAQALDSTELAVCLMLGTAALPHVVMYPLMTRSTEAARTCSAWTLVWIALLAFLFPTYMTLANAAAGQEQTAVMTGLLAAIPLAGVLAGASASLIAMANSLEHDVCGSIVRLSEGVRLVAARTLTAIAVIGAAALAAYGAAQGAFEAAPMLAWAFSLSSAGLFPALVLGIWWTRTTTAGATAGIVSGFGLSLFYLLVSRYFPQAGIVHFGMQPLTDPGHGLPLVDAAEVLSHPYWRDDVPASAVNPLASRVGWLNVSNLSCGIFGLVAGFAVTAAVSLLGKRPSAESRERIEALCLPGATSPS